MSVAKSLNEEQIAQIQSWVDDGADLQEIQRRLDADLSVKVTYMEVRFLMDDLGMTLKSDPPPPEPEPEPEAAVVEEEPPAGSGNEAAPIDEGGEAIPPEEGGGNVTVTISDLVRPGAMASGRVTFANGKGADWWMDQMGQLGMNGDDKAYRPTEADMIGFQQELARVAKAKGF